MGVLSVQNVGVVYPNGTQALKSISFEAHPGELIAIIGRSGAGKSTLLRALNGMQTVSSGKIMLDDIEITALNKRELAKLSKEIGFIWQEYNLVNRLSANMNVLTGRLGYNNNFLGYFGYFSREHREIASRSLARVNMLHRAKFRADRLSGGEKQRVNIARAISQQPRLLLADEPVASLDPELSWTVMGDFARIAREEGVPTLINIHEVELAKAFTDRMIGIAKGVVVFDGTPSQLDEEAMDRIYRFDKDQHETIATESHANMLEHNQLIAEGA